MSPRKKKGKRMYQVVEKFRGKVRLQTGDGETLLDETTPQDVLAQLHAGSTLGKMYIELVDAAAAVATETK